MSHYVYTIKNLLLNEKGLIDEELINMFLKILSNLKDGMGFCYISDLIIFMIECDKKSIMKKLEFIDNTKRTIKNAGKNIYIKKDSEIIEKHKMEILNILTNIEKGKTCKHVSSLDIIDVYSMIPHKESIKIR